MAPQIAPRQKMRDISLEERRGTLKEVHLGFNEEEAVAEASRCLNCKVPRCSQKGCPMHNLIPQWIALIKERKFMEAAELSRTTSPIPEICSRICPHDRLCEGNCVLGVKNEPVAIGALERFINDYAFEKGDIPIPVGAKTGKKVAIIGGGPAGLAVAEQMIRKGHEAVIYDSMPLPGGLIANGLPGFKIDPGVVQRRWKLLEKAGVKYMPEWKIPEKITLNQMLDGLYDAVFVGIGAWVAAAPKIEGMDSKGVIAALDYLRATEKDLPVKGKPVLVLGGGDTAMDCARVAVRRGATRAIVAYRRDEANMPGSKKEVKAAKEEGVEFNFLVSPNKFISEGGSLKSIEFQQMELGEPDAEGRRSPKPVPGKVLNYPAEIAVLAFGFKLDKKLVAESLGLGADKWGNILINPETGATTRVGVFAGGDCTNGADLASTAVACGRKAAAAIDKYLSDRNWAAIGIPPECAPTTEAK
jgi:glutamate synthase small subunit-like protein